MLKNFFKKIWNKIKQIRINKLFYNNKFVVGFSIVASIVLWVIVSSGESQNITAYISDIPVNITLSESAVQDGLRVFTGTDTLARVEISGNRLIVGQITKNNIQVSAPQAATTIIAPGNYTLELSAKKTGMLTDYEIIPEINPSIITVKVDRYREAEFNVETQIQFTAKKDYFVGNTVLSVPKIKVSGPESEVSKIKKVMVKGDILGEINSPTSIKLPVLLYDAYNEPISSETIIVSNTEIEAIVPVLMKKKLAFAAEFKNVPSNVFFLKNSIKVTPNYLEVAGPEDILQNTAQLSLQAGDFSEINLNNNKFAIPIILPKGCRNLNEIETAEISVNMNQFREKTFNISDFKFKNLPENKKAKIYNNNITVKVIAPYTKINQIKNSDVAAEIDFSEKASALGSMEMPLKITVNKIENAWVIGEYFVNVQLE